MKSIEFLEKNGVDVQKSLDLFGNIETYNDTIGEFLVGIHTKIKQLIDLMEKKDLANYAIYVHSMKSDAKYFGFTKLAEIAYDLELKSKAGDLYYIQNHMNDLIAETNNSIKLIQSYMSDEEEKEEKTQEEKPREKKNEYTSKTILVVDDSSIVRNFVKKVFSDKYFVGSANDGEEAIEIIQDNEDNDFIETILLDLNMPRKDGFAVLDYMKENNLLEKIPVSIISGDSSKETIDRAFTYPIIDMLEKPFNEQSVKMVIEKTIIYKDMNK